MKLYISYYGNYVTIVEGIYNSKKQKYDIKNVNIISSQDIKIDSSDKYSLLKEALKTINTKTKDVVLLLNTRDVIIKSTQMGRIEPKDLDGVMQNEIYEMMSLHDEQYTFSYEVTNERNEDGKEVLDIVMAAISNDELETISRIFKDAKLRLECIDTISTAYGRILKNIEYKDVMMLNVGSYGSIVNIYKEDSLFIHDNIPVRINEGSNYLVSTALVDELKGLTNFFSSRNYGKLLDTIVLLGESNENKHVKQSLEESFTSKLVLGIENLFDIENDIDGDLLKEEISKVCDVLGSMLIPKYNSKQYAYMNLLPLALRNRNNKKNKLKKVLIAAPIIIAVLALPSLIFNVLTDYTSKKAELAQSRLDELLLQYEDIEDINEKIKKAEEEIDIYDMLSSKSARWGKILSSIDKSIPYRVDLTNVDTYYDSALVTDEEKTNSEEEENTQKEENKQETTENQEQSTEEQAEKPIYDQLPNTIVLDGISKTPERIGQFVYSLNQVEYFESATLISSTEDEENNGHKFNIVLVLKEGVVSGD